MIEDPEVEGPPPQPSNDVLRAGQSDGNPIVEINSGLPSGSAITGLPQIILEGALEAVHSSLTWKLISKVVSVSEEERDTLRAERNSARAETEHWRTRAECLSGELIDARARWDSVSSLTNAQALLYVVGGVLVGPAVPGLIAGKPEGTSMLVALLGVAGIVGAYILGGIGPKRGR